MRPGFAGATGGAGRGAATSRGAWNDAADGNRRSVYIFLKRNAVYPMLEAFDAPNPQETCSRRFRSVIPSQSLILMNDPLVLEWSRALAGRVLNDGGLSLDQQVDRAYRLALSRAPNAEERAAVLDFLQQQATLHAERLARNEKPPRSGRVAGGHGRRRAPRLSWIFVIRC